MKKNRAKGINNKNNLWKYIANKKGKQKDANNIIEIATHLRNNINPILIDKRLNCLVLSFIS